MERSEHDVRGDHGLLHAKTFRRLRATCRSSSRLARVAPRFHEVWGVAPALGRGFTPADNQEGAASVVLISDRFWATQLDERPERHSRELAPRRSGGPIVGVMPASFQFPDATWICGRRDLFAVGCSSAESLVVQRLRPSRARCVRRAGARGPRGRTGGAHRTVSGNRSRRRHLFGAAQGQRSSVAFAARYWSCSAPLACCC